MSLFSRSLSRIGALGAALVALTLSGCTKAEWMGRQSAMDPHGPIGQMQFDVFMDTVWLSLVLFVIVGGAFVYAVIRFREKPEDAGKPVESHGHGNPMIEIGIIFLSIFALVLIAIPTLKGVWLMYDDAPEESYRLNGENFDRHVSAKESALKQWFPHAVDNNGVENYAVKTDDDVLEITVVGKQWWFRFEYPQFGLDQSVNHRSVSNEFVIPVGRVVKINLRSDDVIHSFWLPKVAGKVDLVPGRKNGMWIQADKPGNYYGQCAEFCGDSHAYMLFRCRAVSDAEFQTWIAEQKKPALTPTSDLAKHGEELFKQKTCIMCHTIGGVSQGDFGPDLTHLGSRTTLAGAWLFNYDDTKHAAAEQAAGNTLVVPVIDKDIQKANLMKWIGSSGMNREITDAASKAGHYKGVTGGNPHGDVKPGNRMHYYNGMFGVTGLQAGLDLTGKFTDESLAKLAASGDALAKKEIAHRAETDEAKKEALKLTKDEIADLAKRADVLSHDDLKALAEYLSGLE